MKITNFVLPIVFCAWLGAGCQSPSKYTSPRIAGRVIDHQTGEPIKDVQVTRWTDEGFTRSMDPPKGDQALDQTPFVLTSPEGLFVMKSERSLAFQTPGWYPVRLVFAHRHYRALTQSFPEARSTNIASTEPQIQIGDVRLERSPK